MSRTSLVVLVAALAGFSPATASADAVLDWNAIMLTTIAGQNPIAQARFAAITHLAVFEAVNAVTKEYTPYLGSVTSPPGASAEAAAVAAAHRVLSSYFPGSAATLDAARATSLSAMPDGQAKDDGIAVGEAAAAAMIMLRANDGSAPPEFFYPSSTDSGDWQLTPSCPPVGGVFFNWRHAKTFGLRSGDQFRSHRPPSLRSRRYARDYEEVKQVGGIDSTLRPQHRADAARFYAVVLVVNVWNPVVRQVATARGTSLSENARAFALLNMAIMDGLISSLETKYHYNFWRPETAIRAGDLDGNRQTQPDAGFAPFIVTPCFPSYPSAHASGSYAAQAIAERIFGDKIHRLILTSPAIPDVTLEYETFEEITDDIDDARIYGGIHFRFDQRAGARQGRVVGAYIFRHFLRPAGPKWH